jgi:hypothetical protein
MGALTSKPYAFNARPWELKSFDSIDLSDAVGSNIRIDMRGLDIMRVLPRINESLNESWITDKARFSYDGLSSQRLGAPLFRRCVRSSFSNISWAKAFSLIRSYLPFSEAFSDLVLSGSGSFEDLSPIKHTFGILRANTSYGGPSTDLLSNRFIDAEDYDLSGFDFFLILGINTRFELPSLNLRIRKLVRSSRRVDVFYSGPTGGSSNILTYPFINVGSLDNFWSEFARGRNKLCRKFYSASRPCVLVSKGAYASLSSSVLSLAVLDIFSLSTLKVLPDSLSRGVLDDLAIGDGSEIASSWYRSNLTYSVFNFGSDNLRFSSYLFNVYAGFHGDQGAGMANLVVPTSHPYESLKSSYINMYGRLQSILKVRTLERFVISIQSLVFAVFGAYSFFHVYKYMPDVVTYSFRMLRYYEVPSSYFYKSTAKISSIYRNDERYVKFDGVNGGERFNVGFCAVTNALFNSLGYSFYFDSSTTRASHLMAVSHNRFRWLTSFGC